MRSTGDHDRSSAFGWQPRPPLDPCSRMNRFGPVRPMEQPKSLWQRLLFG
ncbi:MAG: hypothetical protein KGM17_07550 [Sphingomonadales bacterium]|nr:hypothetical protein [Sphingomonadales bacterium]